MLAFAAKAAVTPSRSAYFAALRSCVYGNDGSNDDYGDDDYGDDITHLIIHDQILIS